MTDRVVGEMVADLGLTREMIATTPPSDWNDAAGIIRAFLSRSPVRDSGRYSGVRLLLGAFAAELSAYARQAGEPDRDEVDIRAADVRLGEREARERAAMLNAS